MADTLYAGQVLLPGTGLRSANGQWELKYLHDGNLTISRQGHVGWQTRTSGKPAGQAAMQTDGHFCLYSPGNVFYWGTGVHGFTDGRLVLQDTGALLVQRVSTSQIVWSVQPSPPPNSTPSPRPNRL